MKRAIKKFLEMCCITGTILIGLAFIAFVGYLIALGMGVFIKGVKLRPVDIPADTPSDGVAWVMPESAEAAVWMAPACAENEMATYMLDTYTEGDGPAPEWWRPDEPMSAVWVAAEPHPPVGIDLGGVDWNVCTTVWGWDGHGAEAWELDLYARIVYLEFWGTSPECCEAGADSILRLWDSGYFGDTLGGVLSARAENGSLVYTTYRFVWDADYDPDGLAEMRELCESRFMNGPEWGAEFFQLYGFPEWAVPMYEIDGVYFSTGKGWN
jgi:hypothetical protein